MKKYILIAWSFFIPTGLLTNHIYHTQGIVKDITGKISPKIPVYTSTNSNTPTGDIYIRSESISGYNIGTYTHTSRKKTRKGTFAISTIKKNVIEDDWLNPLAKKNRSGDTKNLLGFIRNPHYSYQNPTASPKNIPLYEYTGTLISKN